MIFVKNEYTSIASVDGKYIQKAILSPPFSDGVNASRFIAPLLTNKGNPYLIISKGINKREPIILFFFHNNYFFGIGGQEQTWTKLRPYEIPILIWNQKSSIIQHTINDYANVSIYVNTLNNIDIYYTLIVQNW